MLASAELLTVFLFIIATILAAGLFCMWVVVLLFRFARSVIVSVWRLVFGGTPATQKRVACRNPQCGAANPEMARFCRRCGQPMSGVMRVVSERAAG